LQSAAKFNSTFDRRETRPINYPQHPYAAATIADSAALMAVQSSGGRRRGISLPLDVSAPTKSTSRSTVTIGSGVKSIDTIPRCGLDRWLLALWRRFHRQRLYTQT